MIKKTDSILFYGLTIILVAAFVIFVWILASGIYEANNQSKSRLIPAVHIQKLATTYQENQCQTSGKYCRKALLQTINHDRIAMGLKPYAMNWHELWGFNGCVGTRGKTLALAESGDIWHVNPSYPQASFPTNICGFGTMTPYGFIGSAGENVGLSTGTEWNAIIQDYNQMKSEGVSGSHYQNLFSSVYKSVAIGIRYRNGDYYIVEDFTD